MIKAVTFDLDDTLLNGKRMHYKAIIEALNKFGYKKKRIKWIRGATTEEILVYNFPDMDEGDINKIARYKRLIVKKYMGLAKLLPHAIELLKYLKQNSLIIGLITNNSHAELKQFLRYFKIGKYFDITIGIENKKPKPSNEMFKAFVKKAKLKPREIIYVGDSNYDIIACKKAKIRIILNTRMHKAKLSNKADFVLKNLQQVKRKLSFLIKS
jgi:pyrophosphatase PpaX